MPNRDPLRSFRCPHDLWREAMEVAKERNEALSLVIRTALTAYVKRHRAGLPERRFGAAAAAPRRDDDPVDRRAG